MNNFSRVIHWSAFQTTKLRARIFGALFREPCTPRICSPGSRSKITQSPSVSAPTISAISWPLLSVKRSLSVSRAINLKALTYLRSELYSSYI